ncbi:RlpA-like domain superfamily protein [Abortiporus biennis]
MFVLTLSVLSTGLAFSSLVSASLMPAVYQRDDGLPHTVNTGRTTFFNPGVGVCGDVNTANDFIVAINSVFFDAFRRTQICNQTMLVQAFGKTLAVKVVDECPTCGFNNIDLSPAAFEFFAPLSTGAFQVQWSLE